MANDTKATVYKRFWSYSIFAANQTGNSQQSTADKLLLFGDWNVDVSTRLLAAVTRSSGFHLLLGIPISVCAVFDCSCFKIVKYWLSSVSVCVYCLECV